MAIMFHNGRILFRNGAIAMDPSCCCSLCPALNVCELQMDITGMDYTGEQPFTVDFADYGHHVLDPETRLYPWKMSSAFETYADDGSFYRAFFWTFYTCGNPDEAALLIAFSKYIADAMGAEFEDDVFIINTPGFDIRIASQLPAYIEYQRDVSHPGAAESPRYADTNFLETSFGCPC